MKRVLSIFAALFVAVVTLPPAASADTFGVNTVDGALNVGEYCSVKLDPTGGIGISYSDVTNNRLKYAHVASGGIVSIETVGMDNAGLYTSLAYDPAGHPYISYTGTDGKLYMAYKGGATWGNELVSAEPAAQFTSIALDLAGRVHISYFHSLGNGLQYATRTAPNTWSIQTVEDLPAETGLYSSLVIDAANRAHIAYYYFGTTELRYAAQTGPTTWSTMTVDPGGDAGRFCSLTRGPGGTFAISYVSSGGTTDTLKLAVDDGSGEWKLYSVKPGAFMHTSCAWGPNGLRISYYDPAKYEQIYAHYESGGWSYDLVHQGNVASAPEEFSSLALTQTGLPVIAFNSYDSQTLMLAIGLPQVNYCATQTGRNSGATFTTDIDGVNLHSGEPDGVFAATLRQGIVSVPGTLNSFSATTVNMSFDLTTRPAGAYDLEYSNNYGTGILPNAVIVYSDPADLFRTTSSPLGDRFAALPRATAVSEIGSIAFVSGRTGGADLFVKEAGTIDAGLAPRWLTSGLTGVRYPSWSRDGQKIAIEASDPVANSYIYIVDADSGMAADFHQVTLGPQDHHPAWSPVGDVLAFVGETPGGPAVFTINADGTARNRITSPGTTVSSPTWSPDGARIAFIRDGEIYSVSATEGEPGGLRQLTLSGGQKTGTAWSPDGRWIAYASDISGNWDIWVIDSRNEVFGKYQITTDPSPDAEPAWSPDGLELAFTSARDASHVIENVLIASNLPVNIDLDADLVPDVRDACPLRNIMLGEIDQNFDGCPDPFAPGFRQVKFWPNYWAAVNVGMQFTTTLDPRIGDGSELTALTQAALHWNNAATLAQLTISTSPLAPDLPVQGDGVNNGAFVGPDKYPFGFGIIAMTPTTYAVEDTVIDGQWYPPGQIVDADLLLNTTYSFSTATFAGGPGAYSLESVATHELGHVLGLSHSCIESSTMFYVVPPGAGAQSLEADDLTTLLRAFPPPAALPLPLDIEGVVKNYANAPVPGAVVLAISDATGDTLEMTLTGVDGSYHFFNEPEAFRVYITPLDGTAAVNGLTTQRVNPEVASVADQDFLPEYYSAIESDSDFNDPGAVITPGAGITTGDIIVNRDTAGPVAVLFNPANGAGGVPVTTAITVLYDEPVDVYSATGTTFVLTNLGLGTSVAGSATTLRNDSLLVFVNTAPLAYDTEYSLVVSGIKDMAGNPMAAPVTIQFHTEVQPAVSIASITPPEAPVGANIVIYGSGFDVVAGNNTIVFTGAAPIVPTAATPDRLFAVVPGGAQTGPLAVMRGPSTDNLPFTVLAPRPLPVGDLAGQAALAGNPFKVALRPDGGYAYVATSAGVSAVDALPTSGSFLDVTNIAFAGGCTGVVALPDGARVLAIGPNQPRLHLIDSQAGGTFNTEIASAGLIDPPLGIAVVPGGGQVLIAYAGRVVLHSTSAGPSFGTELREWSQGGVTFLGDISVAPGGDYAYAATGSGSVAVLDLAPGQGIVNTLASGITPHETAANPAGARVVGLDDGGVARLYGSTGPLLHTLNVGGGYSGLAFSPEGTYAFAANFIANRVDVLGFSGNQLTNPGSFNTGIDPRDLAVGPGGRYVYVVTNGSDRLEVYDTSTGVRVDSVHPGGGGMGTLITIKGSGFSPVAADNKVMIGNSSLPPLTVDAGGSVITVRQSVGAVSGPISVQLLDGSRSNTVAYKVMYRPDPGNFKVGQTFPTGGAEVSRTVMTPNGHFLVALHTDGTLSVIQGDQTKPRFHRVIQSLAPAASGLTQPAMMAITPDGKKLYVPDRDDGTLAIFSIDELSPAPLTRTGVVINAALDSTFNFKNVAVNPAGTFVYAATDLNQVAEISTATDQVAAFMNVLTDAGDGIAVHPDGRFLYAADTPGANPTVACINIDPASPMYRSAVGSVTLVAGWTSPVQLVASPDGTRLFAAGDAASSRMYIVRIDIDPQSPGFNAYVSGTLLVNGYDGGSTGLAMNHSGTALFYPNLSEQRIYTYDQSGGGMGIQGPVDPAFDGTREMAISLDDARLYYPGPTGEMKVVDLTPVSLTKQISGFAQSGVVNQPLAAPFVFQGTAPDQALAEGAMFEFDGTAGGGGFGEGDAVIYAAADAGGFVRATYVAGPAPGAQFVNILTPTMPMVFSINVLADLSLLPPQVLAVSPTPAGQASVTTPVVVDFSKPLDLATVNISFALHAGGGSGSLPGVFTFTSGNQRIVFQPDQPLLYNTPYDVVISGGIRDLAANPLSNPGTWSFTTGNPPPLVLNAIDPPAARVGDPVVFSGSGFSRMAGANHVFFGGVEAPIKQSDPAAITVLVPGGAATGTVHVQAGAQNSNTLEFTLVVAAAPVNNVVANVAVPTSGQQVAIVPDGSRAYMTSPGANAVVPINLNTRQAEAAIAVGVSPFGVVSSPSGDRIFVTNFYSSNLSIIDANPAHGASFKTVVGEIPLGLNPSGVAVHPDGRSLYAVNYGDKSLMVVDTDSTSAAYNRLRATVSVSDISQAIAITPDGARLIVGTSTGIMVMNAVNPGDVGGQVRVSTGSTGTSVGVSPDGAFAVFLTADGDLHLVDIRPGSPTQYQGQVRVSTGSTGTSVGVSPDGGFVYVTLLDGTVLVYRVVQLGGGGAVVSRDAASLPFELQIFDTIEVGENPVAQAFDPSGSGLLIVVNAGSNDVSFISTSASNPIEVVPQLDVNPNTLNFSSRGQYLTAYIEFAAFLDPALVNLASVRLNGTVPALPEGSAIVDHDGDGLMERQVRFDRSAVVAVLPEGQKVPVTVTGTIDGRPFSGDDSLKVIRPVLRHPAGGELIAAGGTFPITWTQSQSGPAHHVDLFWSRDLGAHWDSIGVGLPDDGSAAWVVPDRQGDRNLIMLVAYDRHNDVIGIASLDDPFTITSTSGAGEAAPPKVFAFRPVSPNPSRSTATFRFDLPEARPVTLKLYSVDGRLVRVLSDGRVWPAGRYAMAWDGLDARGAVVGSGVYFVRIEAGGWTALQKMVRTR